MSWGRIPNSVKLFPLTQTMLKIKVWNFEVGEVNRRAVERKRNTRFPSTLYIDSNPSSEKG